MARELRISVSPDSRELEVLVRSVAEQEDRPQLAIRLQALLQLPRIADEDGFVSADVASQFLRELAVEVPISKEWAAPDSVGASPRGLIFNDISYDEARDVMERFHYLHSARFDGRIYGLRSKAGHLVALCVSSPLDVNRLVQLLHSEGRMNQTARVLSRVFVFEGSPPNTISYLLSQTTRAERRLGVTDLVTYVNPNMGFHGVSYLASGWHLLGDEPGTTYRYLDSRYVTDRELTTKFGSHDDGYYYRILGKRFEISKMLLAPLLVFSNCLSKTKAHVHSRVSLKRKPGLREQFPSGSLRTAN